MRYSKSVFIAVGLLSLLFFYQNCGGSFNSNLYSQIQFSSQESDVSNLVENSQIDATTNESSLEESVDLQEPITTSFVFPDSVELQPFSDPLKNQAMPNYLSSFQETQFGTVSTRVATKSALGITNNPTHSYSKRQAWNIDESFLVVRGVLLDAETYRVIRSLPVSSEFNWSNLNRSWIYAIAYTSGKGNDFVRYDVEEDKKVSLRLFSNHNSCSFGSGEGNLTNDDRFVVIRCDSTLYSFDIRDNKILGQISIQPDFNWAGFSQLGNHIIVSNNAGGERNVEFYDKFFKNKRSKNYLRFGHGDFGLDEEGNEVYFQTTWNYLFYDRLSDLKRVWVIGNESVVFAHGHISCRNLKRPGVCYFSLSNYGLIGSVRVPALTSDAQYITTNWGKDGKSGYKVNNNKFEIWGHHRSDGNIYDAQPKASVSPSGRQIIYNTNWFDKGEITSIVVRPDQN